jgi:probable phosphoglycerate mutase
LSRAVPQPRLVLVRHGETEWSRDGRHTSRTDLVLTARGREEAVALGDRLRPWRFALVLVSPLARAMETCRLAGYGEIAERRDDLMEWDYGDYEGRTTIDIRIERPGWSLWTDGAPGGETARDVGERADRIVGEVRAASGDTAVFAHGHLLRVLAARWVALPPVEGRILALAPATTSVLGFERETPVIVRWNQGVAAEPPALQGPRAG